MIMNIRYSSISILIFVFTFLISNLSFSDSIWSKDYKGEAWHENFSVAKKVGVAQNKPILVYFSGSDWCKSCAKLDQSTLIMPGFQKRAKESLILMNADFPNEAVQDTKTQQQNNQLREQYGVSGFPTMVLVNASSGEQIAKFSGCSLLSCKEGRVLKKLDKALKSFSGT